jgi:DNA-binding response OmpR family regulator
MISANKDTEKIAKEAGADGFLAKPFEMKDLLSKVATFSRRKNVRADKEFATVTHLNPSLQVN